MVSRAAFEAENAAMILASSERDAAELAKIPPVIRDPIKRLMFLDQESVFALADIAAERLRQIEKEGWTPEHDAQHHDGELSTAAAAYALALHTPASAKSPAPSWWPWGSEWWKPRSSHRNRVRAGALLVAELARHLRSAPAGR